MTTSTFTLDTSLSGNIDETGPWTITTGAEACQIELDLSDVSEKRAFFFYNTSTLPDNAIIDQWRFKVVLSPSQPTVQSNSETIYVGDFGNSMDYTDFTIGDAVLTDVLINQTWYIMPLMKSGYINKQGYTCIKIEGNFDGLNTAGRNYNDPFVQKENCKLEITWHIPDATLINDAYLNNCTIN